MAELFTTVRGIFGGARILNVSRLRSKLRQFLCQQAPMILYTMPLSLDPSPEKPDSETVSLVVVALPEYLRLKLVAEITKT